MKTAAYTSAATSAGKTGVYPLSTEALEFIQSQVQLLQQLSLIGGSRYILKEPDGTSTGVCVIDGEVFTMAASPVLSSSIKYINVTETTEDIEADGETYEGVRTTRTAAYSSSEGSEAYSISEFTSFATNSTLYAQVQQLPATVLTYLADVLEEKLSVLSVSGMTTTKLKNLTTPCLVSCTDSVALFDDYTEYSVLVTQLGDIVRQEMTLPNGRRFVRVYSDSAWGDWGEVTDNLHIEAKISGRTVYLRHGYLPSDVEIVLLRKKKRSKYRRTGGSNAYTANQGTRTERLPKTQFVHFKGIVLSQGSPNEWYVPKCLSVYDSSVDGSLVGKELPTLCKSLIQSTTWTDDGGTSYPAYKIQGVRKLISKYGGGCGKGYASIAIQVARTDGTSSKEAGGEMVRLKYRIANKVTTTSATSYTSWYRSFSLD